MAKARILIVEDEALVARDLVNTVKSLGYEVTDLVQNGEVVVQSVEKNLPDLAIMDSGGLPAAVFRKSLFI